MEFGLGSYRLDQDGGELGIVGAPDVGEELVADEDHLAVMEIHFTDTVDVTLSAGFGSIATFNRVFRESRGCTPSRYREIYGDL